MRLGELRGLLEHLNEDNVDLGELEKLVTLMRHFFTEKAKQGGGSPPPLGGSGRGTPTTAEKALQEQHDEMRLSYEKKVHDLQQMLKRSEIESAENVR